MNRLQKKCVVVSAGLHLLLLGILVFGSALMPQQKVAPSTTITMFDPKLLSDAATTGGNPNVAPAAAPAPPPPAPQAPPEHAEPPKLVEPPKTPVQPIPKLPDPVKPPVKTKAPEPRPVEPPKTEKAKSTLTPAELAALKNPLTKPPKDLAQEQAKAAEDAKRRADAKRQQEIAKQFATSLNSLKKGMSPATTVVPHGSGGDGPLAANYRDLVGSKYKEAWTPPPELSDELATVTASITIDRNGTVMSARITKPSGNRAMDRSIQTTLENVKEIAPFPESSKEQQRTYDIQFNLRAKLAAG